MDQIIEMIKNLDIQGIIEKIVAFIKDFLANIGGSAE